MAVNGVPLLYHTLESVKQLGFLDEVVVATTLSKADDPILAACESLGVSCVRGDSENVLSRFVLAAEGLAEEDAVIRFTADNPVYNKALSNKALEVFSKDVLDYLCVDGLSHLVPEYIRVRGLREIDRLAEKRFDREHVTPYFRKNRDLFNVSILPRTFGGLRPEFDRYLGVDTRDDLNRYEAMLSALGQDTQDLDKIYSWLAENAINKVIETGKVVELNGIKVGHGQPTFIIAEIGQNHNGSVELAKQLIDMAVRCQADAVKFQKRDIPSELTKEAYDRPYNSPNSFGRTYGEHRIALELDEEQHLELKEYASAQGITYFCTPCDVPSVEMMERIGVPFYKVASRDLTNLPTLEAMAKTGKPVIISTGMANMEDIEDGLEALGKDRDDVIILQCTSQYPAALENVNLRAMNTLEEKFGKIVGFSDHTVGVITSVAASVMGAAVIEKHVTLSRAMKGSDQAGSLEETGLRQMVKYIRECELAKGDGVKVMNPVVEAAKEKLARSLTSKMALPAGTILEEKHLVLKSPGNGLTWSQRHQVLGKKVIADIPPDATIWPENLA